MRALPTTASSGARSSSPFPAWLVVIGLALFAAGSVVAYYLFGHVRTRVETWLDPFGDQGLKGGHVALLLGADQAALRLVQQVHVVQHRLRRAVMVELPVNERL